MVGRCPAWRDWSHPRDWDRWDGTRCFTEKCPKKSTLTPTLSRPKRTGEGERLDGTRSTR